MIVGGRLRLPKKCKKERYSHTETSRIFEVDGRLVECKTPYNWLEKNDIIVDLPRDPRCTGHFLLINEAGNQYILRYETDDGRINAKMTEIDFRFDLNYHRK